MQRIFLNIKITAPHLPLLLMFGFILFSFFFFWNEVFRSASLEPYICSTRFTRVWFIFTFSPAVVLLAFRYLSFRCSLCSMHYETNRYKRLFGSPYPIDEKHISQIVDNTHAGGGGEREREIERLNEWKTVWLVVSEWERAGKGTHKPSHNLLVCKYKKIQ